jgi:hypothetical protein
MVSMRCRGYLLRDKQRDVVVECWARSLEHKSQWTVSIFLFLYSASRSDKGFALLSFRFMFFFVFLAVFLFRFRFPLIGK